MNAEIEEGDTDEIMPCTRRSSPAASIPAAAPPPAVEVILAVTSDGRYLLLPLLPPCRTAGAQKHAHPRSRTTRAAAGARVVEVLRIVVASSMLLPCW